MTYSHKVVQPIISHPDIKQIIPLMPEEICHHDGDNKQDCGAPRGAYDTRGESPLKKAVPAASWIELWAYGGDDISYA